MNRRRWFFLAFFGVGVATDFIFNGVFKIVWFLVYAPSYLAIAKLLGTRYEKTEWEPYLNRATLWFFVGTIAAHLALANRHSSVTFAMDLTADSPMTFTSPRFPQYLIVVSEPLRKKFADGLAKTGVPLRIVETTNYGCIASYRVTEVAGIDVLGDRDASWTWKTDSHSPAPENQGPGTEDRVLPWCLIKFYRS